VARYLLSSHDGFGLGHVRRNFVIAKAIKVADPAAQITIVSGLAVEPSWFVDPALTLVRLPPLLKIGSENYCGVGLSFEATIAARAQRFRAAVDIFRPDVILVDRHPWGVGGELFDGLFHARQRGARTVLGLRDVLDEPEVVARELRGDDWQSVAQMFDEVFVYGSQQFCDQQREYGLPVAPTYTGWVAQPSPERRIDPRLLVITAGGGADGADVFRLAVATLERRVDWRGLLATGPYADLVHLRRLVSGSPAFRRMEIAVDVPGCGAWFARAGAVLQMAGYNSTFEALASGCRPILVPRRHPRREQLIRATRLAALGLADVLDGAGTPGEVDWLLDQPRRLAPGQLGVAGIELNGAERAASLLAMEAGVVPTHADPAPQVVRP
jgi:predicted glycosyltransferase